MLRGLREGRGWGAKEGKEGEVVEEAEGGKEGGITLTFPVKCSHHLAITLFPQQLCY